MARPAVHAATDELYESLGSGLTREDESTDWHLLKYVDSFGSLLGAGDDLLGTEDEAAWTRVLDPDRVDLGNLPFLGQFSGTVVDESRTEAEQRAQIKDASGWERGTRKALVTDVQATLITPLPTFTRASIAHEQDGSQVAAGVPRYETGKHSTGIMVEEGTLNLLSADGSSFEGGTGGWQVLGGANAPTRTTDAAYHGAASLRVEVAATGGFQVQSSPIGAAVVAGNTYTGSVRYRGATIGRSIRVKLRWFDAAQAFISETVGGTVVAGSAAEWRRASVTAVAPAGAVTASVSPVVDQEVLAIGEIHYFDGAQIETKTYATGFQIGGTERAAETLTVPTAGVFDGGDFTVEMWVNHKASAASLYLWRVFVSPGNVWLLATDTAGQVFAQVGSGGTFVTSDPRSSPRSLNTWYHVALVCEAGTMRLYIDGAQVAANAYTEPQGSLSGVLMDIGSAGGTLQANGILDDLRISSEALSAAEIAETAASGSPAPVNPNTTYKLPLDGSLAAEGSAGRTVYIGERAGSAYGLAVQTLPSETPDQARTLAAILGQKPGGIKLYFTVSDEATYALAEGNFRLYSDAEAAFGTYADAESWFPAGG